MTKLNWGWSLGELCRMIVEKHSEQRWLQYQQNNCCYSNLATQTNVGRFYEAGQQTIQFLMYKRYGIYSLCPSSPKGKNRMLLTLFLPVQWHRARRCFDFIFRRLWLICGHELTRFTTTGDRSMSLPLYGLALGLSDLILASDTVL